MERLECREAGKVWGFRHFQEEVVQKLHKYEKGPGRAGAKGIRLVPKP